LKAFPDDVKDAMGFALYQAQMGLKALSAKPLRGYRGAGVVEIIEDSDSDTFRAVYTVKFLDFVYVLHAFQKKSKRGISTPKSDLYLIKRRLRDAERDFEERHERHNNERKD
jgi:phage-related protein